MTQCPDDPPSLVYSPDNEPYLGNEHVHTFDLTISRAMQFLNEAGHRTFTSSMNALQTAAAEIIPQGMSIVLSIREMIRQAYLGEIGVRPRFLQRFLHIALRADVSVPLSNKAR